MRHLKTHTTFAQQKRIDWWLLTAVLLLSAFGLLMVYDASVVQAFQNFGDKYFFIRQQLIWMTLGVFSLVFFTFFNYRYLQKFAGPAFLVSFILLIMVFIPGLGVSAGGAHRWLKLGGFTIQPTEIIKLSSIVFFASLFQKGVRPAPFLIILSVVVLIMGLFQKDLGSAIVFSLTAMGVFYAAGASIYYFLAFIPVSLLAVIGFTLSSAYRRQRVLAFIDPFADPSGFSYHISQVLIALGSGGLFGLGVGQSRQKFAYIPEVTTDSIFSIIGEEFGFIGSMVLILFIGVVLFRGFKIAERCTNPFGKILASGLVIWLGAQACVNLAAMVSLIPLTGVPLPFISYGGSALLCNLTAVGILLNISRTEDRL